MIFYAKREVLLMEMESTVFSETLTLSELIKTINYCIQYIIKHIIGLQTGSINILLQHHEIFFDNNIITGWVTANIVFTII